MRYADKYNTPFIPHVETHEGWKVVQHSHASELTGYFLLSMCTEVELSCAALVLQVS